MIQRYRLTRMNQKGKQNASKELENNSPHTT